MGGMVDLVILEVLEMQVGVASEEALEVEVLAAAGPEAEAALAAVVPVGEEDNLPNI